MFITQFNPGGLVKIAVLPMGNNDPQASFSAH